MVFFFQYIFQFDLFCKVTFFTLVTFTHVYVAEENVLIIQIAFVSLNVLNIMNIPIKLLPLFIIHILGVHIKITIHWPLGILGIQLMVKYLLYYRKLP